MSRYKPNDRVADRFVIQGWLASGGMAEIYVAEMALARGMKRRVALKRIHSNFAADPEFVAMFLAEARLSSELVHPGIVPVLDVVEAEGELVIVLDYVPGWDLGSILSKARGDRRFPCAAAVHLGRSLCEVLAYVHGVRDAAGRPRGLVHRDVNPSNVLIAEDGTLRLLDFGVAKAAEQSAAAQTLGIRGKLAYLAPEQAAQGPLDARTDLYGVGLSLYEALSGQRALMASNEIALLEAARAAEIPPLRTLRPDLPEELGELIGALLAKDPARRPVSAEAAASSFERLERALESPREQLRHHVQAVMGSGARAVQGAALGLDAALAQIAGVELARPPTRVELSPEVDPTALLPERRRRRPWWIALGAAGLLGALALLRTAPTSTPPAPVERGFLRISSTPPGARVFVDGQAERERTPLILEAPAGVMRRLRLELEDHETRTTTASALAGQTTPLELTLGRTPGRLVLQSDPPGASISVDGIQRGVTPLVLEGLPRAQLEISADLSGYEAKLERLSLVESSSRALSFALMPIFERGLVDISATPWAKVKIDGRWVAESTPVLGLALPVGAHTVELVNPRLGKSARRSIMIKKGARVSVIVRFD